MKILFIYPNIGQMKHYNHGIGILAGILNEKGYQVDLLIAETGELSFLKRSVLSSQPDIICFSVSSHYWEFTKHACHMIKSEFKLPVFCGGIHFTVCPESIKESSCIDGICVGEGDLALPEIIERISEGRDYKDVKNFWFREGDRVIKNPIRELMDDLDCLPFPLRKIFPDEYILNYPTFCFSRGCPYSCSYCCNEVLHHLYKDLGYRLRFRKVEQAIEEIRLFLKRYNVEYIGFDDDSFTKDKAWLEKFCNAYTAQRNFPPFACNTRPEIFGEDEAVMLKKAGCFRINIGIESGSEKLRRDVLDRAVTNKQIIRAFDIAKKYNILMFSFNMIGFPGETKTYFKETIELNREILPDMMQLAMFYPYPGTALGDLSRRKGYISNRKVFNYFKDTIMELPDFPRREILWSSIFFRFNVYKFVFPMKAVHCLLSDLLKFVETRNSFLEKVVSPIRFIWKTIRY